MPPRAHDGDMLVALVAGCQLSSLRALSGFESILAVGSRQGFSRLHGHGRRLRVEVGVDGCDAVDLGESRANSRGATGGSSHARDGQLVRRRRGPRDGGRLGCDRKGRDQPAEREAEGGDYEESFRAHGDILSRAAPRSQQRPAPRRNSIVSASPWAKGRGTHASSRSARRLTGRASY